MAAGAGPDAAHRTSSLNAADFLSKRKGWEPTDVVAYLRGMQSKLGSGQVSFSKNESYKTQSALTRSRGGSSSDSSDSDDGGGDG